VREASAEIAESTAVYEKCGRAVAIMPHCVVCGFDSGAVVVGSVEFADYNSSWREPMRDGSPVIGWSNALGVTAPEGVGLFCREHLKRAKRLRRLRSEDAVELMRRGKPSVRERIRGVLGR
jgi:hypothetical protein